MFAVRVLLHLCIKATQVYLTELFVLLNIAAASPPPFLTTVALLTVAVNEVLPGADILGI